LVIEANYTDSDGNSIEVDSRPEVPTITVQEDVNADNTINEVEIGDKVITIQDFIRRAEYTIRPPYCSQGNYIHKKIILNSLIAEKLTALEFEKSSISASENKNFQAYLTGRKEQAMRQKYFAEEYYAKTVIPDEEMKTAYTLSQRKVRIDYLNLPDLKLSCTAVRIPTFRAHAEAVTIETEQEVSVEKIHTILAKTDGVDLTDNPAENEYPMPLTATKKMNTGKNRLYYICFKLGTKWTLGKIQ